ncbi:MAG: hypothetical protein ACTSU5_15115 [Promethearchaeota archaeon]
MTIYDFSVISTTGYPFYYLKLSEEPEDTDLRLLFFHYHREDFRPGVKPESTFELNAGLISALYEFAKLLDQPIDFLQFKKVTVEVRESKDKLDSGNSSEFDPESDIGTIITTRCDVYNRQQNVKEKVDLIFEKFFRDKHPLGPDKELSTADKEKIRGILANDLAKARIRENEGELDQKSEEFLSEMRAYGLIGLLVCAFDMSILRVWGLQQEDAETILRNLGEIPHVDTYNWKYRQSKFRDTRVWAFIVNSGCGVEVEGHFQHFHYFLISQPGSFLGEVPAKLYQMYNDILDK